MRRNQRARLHGAMAEAVALSGYGQAPEQATSNATGFDVHLVKPVDMQRLLAQVGDGAIVVLHDGDRGRDDAGERAYEASLAPLLIAALRAQGYQFVTLDQLVAN